ncbi:MAG: UbiA-like polyprenyltransferase [Nitrospirota bacterium]
MGLLGKIAIYLEMIKFPHTVFALPFAFMGAVLAARGIPDWDKILWITIAMVGARSSAMGFNRLTDRHIDAMNPRTSKRALPMGLVTPREVILFITFFSFIFIYATYRLNPLAFSLSPVALVIVFFYSYTKRLTWMSHIFLGIALSLAPAGAWIAVRGAIDMPAIILGIAVVFWLVGFDILYALQDIDFDRKAGIHSIPQLIGIKKSLLASRFAHIATATFLFFLYPLMDLGVIYLSGVLIVVALLIYEHSLVKEDDLSRLDVAFFNMNGYISITAFVFTLIDILTGSPQLSEIIKVIK